MISQTASAGARTPANGPVTRVVSYFAGVLSLLLAFGPPLVLYLWAYQHHHSQSQLESRIVSARVTEVIAIAPDTWQHRHLKLLEILLSVGAQQSGDARRAEQLTIASLEGTSLASVSSTTAGPIAWPRMTEVTPIFDQGEIVGHVTVTMSLREDAERVALVFLFSLSAGLVCFAVLRGASRHPNAIADACNRARRLAGLA